MNAKIGVACLAHDVVADAHVVHQRDRGVPGLMELDHRHARSHGCRYSGILASHLRLCVQAVNTNSTSFADDHVAW